MVSNHLSNLDEGLPACLRGLQNYYKYTCHQALSVAWKISHTYALWLSIHGGEMENSKIRSHLKVFYQVHVGDLSLCYQLIGITRGFNCLLDIECHTLNKPTVKIHSDTISKLIMNWMSWYQEPFTFC